MQIDLARGPSYVLSKKLSNQGYFDHVLENFCISLQVYTLHQAVACANVCIWI